VFTNSDGVNPSGGVVLPGQIMYGTANSGGTNGSGTVFAITNGAFNLLRTFTALNLNTLTNADGANPNGGLILSGGTLYGTASAGGAGGNGTVFSINTNGTGFNRLYSFTAVNPTTLANPDGANPSAGLVRGTRHSTEQLTMAAPTAMARFSRSAPTATSLSASIALPPWTQTPAPTRMERIQARD